jgi:hypothetical protein
MYRQPSTRNACCLPAPCNAATASVARPVAGIQGGAGSFVNVTVSPARGAEEVTA